MLFKLAPRLKAGRNKSIIRGVVLFLVSQTLRNSKTHTTNVQKNADETYTTIEHTVGQNSAPISASSIETVNLVKVFSRSVGRTFLPLARVVLGEACLRTNSKTLSGQDNNQTNSSRERTATKTRYTMSYTQYDPLPFPSSGGTLVPP